MTTNGFITKNNPDPDTRFTQMVELAEKSVQRTNEIEWEKENACGVCDGGRLLHPGIQCRKCIRIGE